MSKRPGVTRQGGVGAIGLGLMLVLSGAWTSGAVAAPDKEPDRTPNDHPSGKDKSAEPGGSGTQGKSTSDPDGMTNGGADKPGGDGGFDADKDGNNGCGNDDDFEDDNNGNCGGRRTRGAVGDDTAVKGTQATRPQGRPCNAGHAAAKADGASTGTKACTGKGTTVDESSNVAGQGMRNALGDNGTAVLGTAEVRATDSITEVLGTTFVRDVGTTAANGETRVLGVSASRGSGGLVGTGSALATTGVPIAAMVALGSVMVATGRALTVAARRDETTA